VTGAYRNRLYALLSNAGYNVDFIGTFTDTGNTGLTDVNHQGQGSARIDQIQTNISGWLNAVEDPDVVLLLIGTNDFWQNYNLGSVQTRMTNLIADIATKRPYAKIIVSNLPPRVDSTTIAAQQVAFNTALSGIVTQQAALGRQVTFLDMYSALTAADINGDGVHPSAGGFDKMGNAWFPAIASVISPQGTANPPVIAKIAPMVDLTHVTVVFSKPVADASTSLANFTIPGLTISSAVLDATTKRSITLTTSAQTPGIVYSLAVSGVRDRTAQQLLIAPGSMVNFSSSALVNGGFESGYAGWTSTGNQELKSGAPYTTTEGVQIVAFNTGQNPPNATLSQTFATTVGQTYQLAFDFGVFSYNSNQQRLQTRVQGATTLVSDTSSLTGIGGGNTRWAPKTFNFVADSTTTTLTFTDVSTTSDITDLVLDNVRVGAQAVRTLAVTSTPASGVAMTISPADITSSGSGTTGLIRSYNGGASVTVTAPAAFSGTNFLRWQKNGVDLIGSGLSITLTMDGDHSLNAVYGSNNAPVAVADAYSTSRNTQLVVPAIGVLTNDTDPDGSLLTAVLNTPPANGTLALNANGSFTYTPTSGYLGADSFTYRANDGVSDSNVVTVSLTVIQTNSQLVVNGSFESDLAGWTTTGNMLVQSSAPYTPTNGTKLLAFNAAQLAPNGVISQSFPTVSGQTYQLAFDVGNFAYNTSVQTIQATVVGSSSLLSRNISLTGLGGGATRWAPQSFSFTANSASTTLSFRDLSTTSNSLDLVLDNVRVTGTTPNYTLTIASSPVSGVSVGVSPADRNTNAGGVTGFTRSYSSGTIVNLTVPNTASGSGFLKWQKNGADFSTSPATSVSVDADMTLTAIYGVNTAPVAVTDSYSTPFDTALVVPAAGVLTNDTDAESNPLTAVLNAGPLNGTISLNPNGGFTYTPTPGYSGPDSFTYRANDGLLNSNVVTVNLNVTGGASASLVNGSFESDETGWTITGNRIVISSTPPYLPSQGNKFMVFNGGNTTPNAVMSQTFATTAGQSYVLSFDVGTFTTSPLTQRLSVALTGGAPLLSQTESLSGSGLSTTQWVAKSYIFTADSATTTVTFGDVSTVTSGADLLLDNVRVGNVRALTVASSPATGINVGVSPNDANGNGGGTTQFVRNYGNGSVVSLTAPATTGATIFQKWQKNGVDFSNTAATSVTVDANMTLTAVYAPNTAPIASANSYSTAYETQLVIAAPGVLGNDIDTESNPLTAVLDVGPTQGTLTLNPDGGFTYTPATGFFGSDSFTYHANDGGLDSGIVTVTLNVSAPNLLVNGGFEAGETGWTITGNRFVIDPAPPYLPSEGSKFVVMNGGQTTPNAVFSQSFATTPGQPYVLNFDLGIVALNSSEQRLAVALTGNTTLFSKTELLFGNSLGNSVWTPKSYIFVADSASTTLTFTDSSTATSNVDVMLDKVSVSVSLGRSLIVASTPIGAVSMTVSPADLNGDGNANTQFARVYADGAVVTVTAPASAGGGSFVKWQKNGSDLTTNAGTTVTMDGNHTLTAVYSTPTAPPFTNGSFESGFASWTKTGNIFLENAAPYAPTNGTALASFNGGNNPPNGVLSQTFATTPGITHTLAFDVGALALTSGQQRIFVTVTSPGTLVSQTITVNGTGSATGASTWLPQSFTFVPNSTVATLTFSDVSATTNLMDLVLDNVRITTPIAQKTLTVESTPASGVNITVSPSDSGGSGNGSTNFTRTYNTGTLVNLTAPATSGAANFVKWQKNGADLTTNNSASVTMDANHTLTAVYQTPPPVTTFVNGGFESGETGWTITGNRIVIDTTPPYNAFEGNKFMVFNGGETTPNAVISQSFTTTPGQNYVLAFQVGIFATNSATQRLGVNVNGTSSLLSQTETLIGNGAGNTVWVAKTYSFTADSTTTTLAFSDLSAPATAGIDLLLDNVRLTAMRVLTVASSPATGLAVTVSPNDADGNGNGTTQFLRNYANGSVVSLTAPAISGASSFLKWQKNGLDFSTTAATSVTVDANMTMTAVYVANTAPVASANSYATPYQTQLVVDAPGVLGNDTDAESAPLTAVRDAGPANGTLTLNPNGGFTYTPANGFFGSDSFTYHANDGGLDSNIVTVSLNVGAPNLIVNGGFEAGETGWTITGNRAVIDSTPPYVPSEGTKFAVLNGGETQPTAVFSQSFATTPGQSYLLTFDIGILSLNTAQQRLTVALAGNSTLFTKDEYLTGNALGNAVWAPRTYAFTADSTTTTLSFTDNSTSTNTIDLLLDNVRVSPGTARTLTVASAVASGVSVTVSPNDLNGSGNGSTQFTRTYADGAAVSLAAPASSGGNTFVKWQKNGVDLTTTPAATVTMDASYTLTAVYEAPVVVPGSFVNGSFEQGFTGWTVTGHIYIESGSPFVATDGTSLAGFNGGNNPPNGVLSQSFNTTPGTSYTLAFDAGVMAFNTNPQSMRVAVTGTGSLLSQTITINGIGGGATRWVPQSFTFVANSANTTLTFTDLSTTTNLLDMVLDNVRVTAGAPVATRTLTVSSTPATGAAITVSPADNNSAANGTSDFTRTYNNGTAVTLTAPATFGGNNFSKWQRNGADLSTGTTANVTMDADYTLTAVYVAPPPPVSFVNGNFEAALSGWTTAGSTNTVVIGSGFTGTNSTSLVKFNSGNTANNGVLSQSFATAAGTSYTVSFDMGVYAFNTSAQRLQVSANGTASLLSQTFSLNGIGSGNVVWSTKTVTFTADSPTTTLTFRDQSTTGNSLDLLLDNVVVTAGTGGGGGATRTLTVNSTPGTGAAITVTPADNASQGNGSTDFNRTYNNGTAVTLTAPATFGGNNFSKWQRNGVDLTTSASTSVTMDANYTLTAVYVAPPPPVSFVNGNFESALSGWTTAGSTDTVVIGSGFTGTNSTNVVKFNSGSTANNGVLSQSFATAPGTSYTVSFDMGVYAFNTSAQVIQVSATGTASLLTQAFSLNGVGNGNVVWSAKTVSFTADSPTTTLTFRDQSTTGNAIDLLLDNVVVTGGAGGETGPTRTLTVNSTPATGVGITVSPVDNASQGNGSTNFTRTYNTGTAVTLVAPFANFVKWTKNGAWYATDPTTTVTLDASHTMTAVYTGTPVLGPFTNGSFESEFTGWTWSGSAQAVKVKSGLPATNGSYVMEFNSNSSPNDGVLTQTFTTTPGTSYIVTFDMGVLAYNTNQQQMQVSVVGSSSLLSQSYTMTGSGNGAVIWSSKSVSFTANSATTTLTFRDQSTTGNALDLLLDNVKVTASAVPPPPSGPNLIANPSFELEPDFLYWVQTGSNRIERPGPTYSTDGNHILSYSVGQTPNDGSVSQTFPTTPGTTYQLNFDLGALGVVNLVQTIRVKVDGSGNILNQTTSVNGRSDFVMVWLPKSFTFTANSTSTTLTLSDASSSGNAMDMFVDKVSVIAQAASIPPPVEAEQFAPAASIAPPTAITPEPQTLGTTPSLTGTPEGYRIGMNAVESGLYVLERSEDLKTWNYHSEIEVTEPGPIEFQDNDTPKARMFYRIGRETKDTGN
jgi:lysophospholipase L1-like esterase